LKSILPKSPKRRCDVQSIRSFRWTALLLIVAAPSPGYAQGNGNPRDHHHPDHARLAATADRIVERYMNRKHAPGLVLAVIRGGEMIVEKGYGVRSPGDSQRPDSDTLFYIGSLSKAITGVGVELLAERGQLSLDEPVARHVRGLPRSWQSIPLKLFLAHQSGIPEMDAKLPTFAETARTADNRPLSFRPGGKQQYNNFNFAIAGQAIEGASGRGYLDFMSAEVFKPLGMTRTGYGQTDPNSSPGHFLRNGGRLEVVTEAVPKGGEYGIPSGFIQTTLGDLVKLYRGIQQHKLLPPARTHEMLSPVTSGLTGTPGWFARKVNGVTIVAKDGAASGYSSQFQFVPGRGDGVIFILNLQGQKLGTAELAHDLLREVCGLPLPERRPGGDD
jgi:CubicO group peptidase (beta-lactamase class C family)